MTVSQELFTALINAMGDRWFPLSAISQEIYYQTLSERFPNDELFEAVVVELFSLDQKNFPSPPQFLEALRAKTAPVYQAALPAAQYPMLSEMEASEREQCLEIIERMKEKLREEQASAPKSAVFSTVGGILSEPLSLEACLQVQRIRLADPDLRGAVIRWAISQDRVRPVCNDAGEVVDLELAL